MSINNEANGDSQGVLSCWKEIAQYMGKGVRTVQRWEQDFGLPVRRPMGVEHKSAVVAHTRDLDAWLESRWTLRKVYKEDALPTPPLNKAALQEMGMKIQLARTLRAESNSLLGELRSELQSLVQTCDQLSKWNFPME